MGCLCSCEDIDPEKEQNKIAEDSGTLNFSYQTDVNLNFKVEPLTETSIDVEKTEEIHKVSSQEQSTLLPISKEERLELIMILTDILQEEEEDEHVQTKTKVIHQLLSNKELSGLNYLIQNVLYDLKQAKVRTDQGFVTDSLWWPNTQSISTNADLWTFLIGSRTCLEHFLDHRIHALVFVRSTV